MLKIATITPVHNRKNITLNCLNSLLSIDNNSFFKNDVVVVDDGSKDGTEQAIAENYPDVKVLKGNGNLWWTGGINLGLKYVLSQNKYNYILLINDDISFEKNFISILLKTLLDNHNSIVGATTFYSNTNIIWKAGMNDTKKLHPLLKNNYQNTNSKKELPDLIEVDVISGRAILVPVKAFKDIGLFDSENFPHGFGDHEFCIRARRKGYNLIINTKAKIFSEPGANKSFFHLIKKKRLPEMVKSFKDIKYDWNINKLIKIYIVSRGKVKGFLGFCIHMAILVKWILFKAILSQNKFENLVNKKIEFFND
jgi:GT2 family glycosyltransferase